MKNPHRWTEAADQCPVCIAILFKSFLSFLKNERRLLNKLKDVIGGSGELKLVCEGIVSEIDTRFLGIVNKGINDQLEGRRRNGHLRRGRHETSGYLACPGDRDRCGAGAGHEWTHTA